MTHATKSKNTIYYNVRTDQYVYYDECYCGGWIHWLLTEKGQEIINCKSWKLRQSGPWINLGRIL